MAPRPPDRFSGGFSFSTRSEPLTIGSALPEATRLLDDAGIEDAGFETRLILSHCLGISQLALSQNKTRVISASEKGFLEIALSRRAGREPLQYIFGVWPFLDFELQVGPEALIPRPETEEWVAFLLDSLASEFGERPFSFADIGTGTGAIGIAINRRFSASVGVLVDVSPEALALARKNGQMVSGSQARVGFLMSDLISAFRDGSLDLVVSNPPYISTRDLETLMPEVGHFEPRLALDGGKDGLDAISRLLAEVCRVLKPGGILAIEHGDGQRGAILTLPAPGLTPTLSRNDAAGRERFLVWRNSGT